MAGKDPLTLGGFCDRAREWTSLRVDGELSPLEEELLERHLEFCDDCRAFEDDVRWATDVLRLTPQERPARRLTLPAPAGAGQPPPPDCGRCRRRARARRPRRRRRRPTVLAGAAERPHRGQPPLQRGEGAPRPAAHAAADAGSGARAAVEPARRRHLARAEGRRRPSDTLLVAAKAVLSRDHPGDPWPLRRTSARSWRSGASSSTPSSTASSRASTTPFASRSPSRKAALRST